MGGLAPTILNAANEIAVDAFLRKRIGFLDIPRVVEETLEAGTGERRNGAADDLDAVLDTDARARRTALLMCERIEA